MRAVSNLLISVLFGALALALACGGHGDNTPAPVITSFLPNPITIAAGGTTALTGVFSNGTGVITPGNLPATSGQAVNVEPTVDTTYTLTVTNSAGKVVTKSVIVRVTPLASLAKAVGDAQVALPGEAVATAPSVVVLDAHHNRAVGIAVTFTVATGGGDIQHTTTLTDTSGNASCGAWTLGSAKGLNTLSASVVGLDPVTFFAVADTVSTDLQVTVWQPTPGHLVGDSMAVIATVASTYQLQTVTASVNGTSIPLAFDHLPESIGGDGWIGTLSLVGQTRGPIALLVTATDIYSNSTVALVPVVLDRPPLVSVPAPLDGTVARPTTQLTATCTDDDPSGPKSFTVEFRLGSADPFLSLSGKNSISEVVDFSAYEGNTITMNIIGQDSKGQSVWIKRHLFVESSSHLSTLAEVNGTPVWDASGTRVLYLDVTGTTPALKINDTGAGTTQTVETGADLVGTWGCYGFLTPTGAIYVHGDVNNLVSPYAWVYEWRNSILTNLAGLNESNSLHVAGNWAIYDELDPTNVQASWYRDLGAGTSTLLMQSTSYGNFLSDVASNGDIVYWINDTGTLGYNIYRWRNGTTQALTNDPYATQWNMYPVTDGVNVVYKKSPPLSGTMTYRIAMNDGSKETILSNATTTEPFPGTGYAAAGGYVAYASADTAQNLQIWRHNPGGEEQLTFFGSSSSIDAIGPDGTIILSHGQKRYRATLGADLQEIGSSLGRVIYRDGNFLVLLGRVVLKIEP